MSLTAAELNAFYSVDESQLDKSIAGIPGKIKASAAALAGAGLVIGGAVAGGLMTGMENERLQDKLAAQLGGSPEYAAEIGGIAGSLYANAYGENLGEVNDAVRAVLQNGLLPEDATNAQIEALTGRVMDFSSAMEQDLGGTTNAVSQMLRTGLAGSAEEALDVLTRGFQQGDDKAGDLLDTFNEYGTQFRRLGLDGPAAMGLITQAIKGGARDSDIAADALKEFGLRAVEGAADAAPYFEDLGLKASDMTAAIAAGGPTASAALGQVLDGLRGIVDPADRARIAAGLFGTQSEDMQAALMAMDTSTAVQALGNVEGAAKGVTETLNGNAATAIEGFKRQAQQAFVDFLGGKALPFISSAASTLATQFGPAVSAVGGFLTGTLVPALKSTAEWISANQTPILIVAGIIAAVFLPHLIALAYQSVLTRAALAAMWLASKVGAIQAAVVHSAQIVLMIGRFVALSAAAVLNAGLTVGAWVGMGIAAVAQAAIVAAAWVGAQIRTVASLVVMAAGFVAQGAVMVASAAVTAAGVVAGWVVMGTQSLIQAARMAAAWFIALGPIGWVIAAVVGLVALIIANWDTVKRWTSQAWSAVSGAVSGAWNNITSAVSSGIGTAVSFVRGLPGQLVGALGNMGSLLYNSGRNLIQGLINGAGSLLKNIGRFFLDMVPGWIRGPFEKALGIASPSKVFAGYGENIGQGLINGMAGMQPAVAAEMQALANYQAMQGLQVRRPAGAALPGSGSRADSGASAAPGAGGPLFTVGHITEMVGTTDDLARKLNVELRVGGG